MISWKNEIYEMTVLIDGLMNCWIKDQVKCKNIDEQIMAIILLEKFQLIM